jgi:hypothetical protein
MSPNRFRISGGRSTSAFLLDMADWYSTGRNEEVVGRNLLKMTALPGARHRAAIR